MGEAVIWFLLAIAFSRPYHPETVDSLHTSRHTHVTVCGTVILTKWEDDGDRHLRIADASGRWIVAEIVPYHPLPLPRLHQAICVSGIHRYDGENGHGWDEVHPVEQIQIVRSRLSVLGFKFRELVSFGSFNVGGVLTRIHLSDLLIVPRSSILPRGAKELLHATVYAVAVIVPIDPRVHFVRFAVNREFDLNVGAMVSHDGGGKFTMFVADELNKTIR